MDILDRLYSILSAHCTDAVIANSPRLTERGTQKVAKALGIAPEEVGQKIAELAKRMRVADENDDMLEGIAPRYTYEEDALGSITVRDTKSDREKFLRGQDASKLRARLDSGNEKEQDILASYFVLEETDELAEVSKDRLQKYEKTARRQQKIADYISTFRGSSSAVYMGSTNKLERKAQKLSAKRGRGLENAVAKIHDLGAKIPATESLEEGEAQDMLSNELAKDFGTFNFPHKDKIATVAYSVQNGKPHLEVVSLRDHNGDEVEMTQGERVALTAQAVKWIPEV